MSFLDWLFGARPCCGNDEQLAAAVERVIEGTDPRLKAVGNVRQRLSPAVAEVLHFTHELAGRLPSCIEMTAENWHREPLLRAFFVRPNDIAETLSRSQDLRDFLGSPAAPALDHVHCAVAATRTERKVLGPAMENGILRQDVARKTVSFSDFRMVGFSATEDALRRQIEEIVLEELVLVALRKITERKEQGVALLAYQQLLKARLRLLEQSGAGLNAALASEQRPERDLQQLRHELAKNEAELGAIKSGSVGLSGTIEATISALQGAEAIIQPNQLALRLNAMNFIASESDEDASTIRLIEVSTINPDRPRRVAFLARFPRQSVIVKHADFDAMLRSI